MNAELPMCPLCKNKLVPLSDYAPGGGEMTYKAWACTNPRCRHMIRIDHGIIRYDQHDKEK